MQRCDVAVALGDTVEPERGPETGVAGPRGRAQALALVVDGHPS